MSDLTFVCKKGLGTIYGNMIRQVALKGVDTWRPIAYNMGKKGNSIGMQGGLNFNTLQVYGATIKQLSEPNLNSNLCVELFRKKDSIFVSQNFELHGLNNLNIDSFEAYLHFASGSYSVEDNASYLQNNLDVPIEDLICISSRHSDVITVTFIIEPIDEVSEKLIFTCEEKPIIEAISSIRKAFTSFEAGGSI